jgi:hypothetical protein
MAELSEKQMERPSKDIFLLLFCSKESADKMTVIVLILWEGGVDSGTFPRNLFKFL